MSEKENSFQNMTPEERKSAAIKQAELLEKGAEITESGKLEVTPEQIETARKEMLAEKTTQRAKELIDLLGPDIEVVIKQLESETGAYMASSDPVWNLKKHLTEFLKSTKDLKFQKEKKE